MTKLEELNIGREIVRNFCEYNNITEPKIVESDAIRHSGYYRFDTPDTIFINLKKCDRIGKNNHPIMIYESTVLGTLMHEFGHYLHFSKHPELTKLWKKIKNEPHTKYFERSVDEDIAESIRLFILCPGRLLYGRRKRCEILRKTFSFSTKYMPDSLFMLYNPKGEKIDMVKWEKFLV